MSDAIDGSAVEVGTELVPHDEHSTTLFKTDDPVQVIRKATEVADALKSVLTSRGMVQNIKGREHVLVSGWQTLGSMLGVVPVVVWTRQLDDGWEARVEARTLDGRVVGAAEAMCTTRESMWAKRDPFALRSMAQTRATSKALRGPLGFVVTLAGYQDTPAEEMPVTVAEPPGPELINSDLRKALLSAFRASNESPANFAKLLDLLEVPQDDSPDRRVARMTAQQARDAITALEVS